MNGAARPRRDVIVSCVVRKAGLRGQPARPYAIVAIG